MSTVVISNEVVISGINANAPISIATGEYSIDGGAYTAAAGSVANDQSVRIRLTSSSQFSTSISAILNVGGVSGSFTAVTLEADTTPDEFQFQAVSNATRGAWINSNAVTISGINTSAPITIENGEYAIDGGAFTADPGSIEAGQSLVIRARASDVYSKIARARVSVGAVSADLEVMSEIPTYVPDIVAFDGQDTVYLLNNAERLILRWSIEGERYLDAYVLDSNTLTPSTMTYSSAHQRLYLGYSSGAIQYLDVSANNPSEVAFANTAMGVGGLVAVGNFVLAQDGSGAWATHYVFNSSGVVTDQQDWNRYSQEYAWDPVSSRVYFFRDHTSPNDLHYEVIDQASGQITSQGETPYHGAYSIQPPIRVTTDGEYILLGSGDIYNRTGLTWAGSIGAQITDARWFANGSMVTLSTANDQTTLRRLGGTNLTTVEQLTYAGQALRVVGTDARMAVLVISGGTVQFHIYVPNDDSDGDGVPNTQDAFPLDPAASLDTDGDGYPDAWNPGMSESDSTTGLTLDAYPLDSACYLLSHGDGVNCNYAATVPNYVPDQVLDDGETIYLLSSANRRVYRWSITTGTYLNPYVVGINQGFTTLAPSTMAYSSTHQRLYLGYSSGAIQYLDVSINNPSEVAFANTAMAVGGLAAVGNFVLAQDGSGAWATHYVFNSSGVVTDQQEWNYYSQEYAWDPVSSRVYFFRDGISPNDLHYEVIDQASGQITSEGETPYHGDFAIQPPIRVSTDGEYILLGSGDVYNRTGLTWAGSIGAQITDARWVDNLLVTLTSSDRVEIRDAATRAELTSYQYLGQPVSLVFGQADAYLVHIVNETTAFVRLPFTDQDEDGLPTWWEQLYGLSDADPADALGDLDGDGVSNELEFLNHTSPVLVDTDSDGLTDYEEIFTYLTDPTRSDSDGDGLNDYDEVITHQTDPWSVDTDGDSFTDFDEVLYGGDPNDPTVLPQPLTTFFESFENDPELPAWTTPPYSHANWAIDTTTGYSGSASLRSGSISTLQSSSTRFRTYFSTGQLTFYARIDSQDCCIPLVVFVDGVQALYVTPGDQWSMYSIPLALGVHEVEWRFEVPWWAQQGSALIDDVTFVAQ